MKPQVQPLLQQAIQAFQSKNFERADSILIRVLQLDSKNLTALHVLGLVKASQGKFQEASELLGKAVRLDPLNSSLQYNLARTLVDSGNLEKSLPHHIKATDLDPHNLGAWLNYGLTLLKLSQYQNALDVYDRAIVINPNYFDFYLGKGAALKSLGRYVEAIAAYELLLKNRPNYVEALSNMGNAHHELKNFDEALVCFDKALSIAPDYHEAWSNKGSSLNQLRRYSEALTCYDKAISINPNLPELWANKSISLIALKRFDEAIAHNLKAIDINPNYPQAWLNKGNVFNEIKKYKDAIADYDQAIRIDPKYAEAWANKGNMLDELKEFGDAILHYEEALRLKPNADWLIGDLIHVKMKILSWFNVPETIAQLIPKIKSSEKIINPFVLLSLIDDADLHQVASKIYTQDRFPFDGILGEFSAIEGRKKIRVGYFSPDFRSHPVAYLTAELFELHDRSKFELFAFSFVKVPEADEMRSRMMQTFDHFIDVDCKSDIQVAALARELNIDIAVDLSGLTMNSRTGIFSYRAAPIQVNYLGYPGTVGASYIDYMIADQTIIPKSSRDFYVEKIVSLPDTYMVDDSKRLPSDRLYRREEFQLPVNAFVFCCFNNSYKFNLDTIKTWSNILMAVKGSVLWLTKNNKEFQENIIVEFEKHGISSDRIIFSPKVEKMADHLARHRLADLFLDTHPYNAHTTAVDALKAGLPVITCMGHSFASRVAGSLLNAIGMPELITVSQEDYQKLAIELATNPEKLANIKLNLSNNFNKTPLFNTPLFVRNIERAYEEMLERYRLGLEPEHIDFTQH